MFESNPGKPFILAGCKTDLRDGKNSENNTDCFDQDGFVSQSQVCTVGSCCFAVQVLLSYLFGCRLFKRKKIPSRQEEIWKHRMFELEKL